MGGVEAPRAGGRTRRVDGQRVEGQHRLGQRLGLGASKKRRLAPITAAQAAR